MNDIQQLQEQMGRALNNSMTRGAEVQGRQALKKALNASTGFTGLNLEEYAKMLLPVYAGLRHRFATNSPKNGATTAQWRMNLGFGSTTFGAASYFGTANGANGGTTNPVATSIAADYKSLSINGDVEREAIQQALGFDNAMSIDTIWALSALFRLEECVLLFGNEAALTPPVITGSPSTLVGTAAFAAGTWHVRVTAITGQGTLPGGAGTAGAVSNNVGESAISNSLAIVVPGGGCQFLDVVIPAVAGAVGYKIYVEAAAAGGTYYLLNPNTGLAYPKLVSGSYLSTAGDAIVVPTGQTYVGVTRVQIITPGVNTQPTDPGASDNSANANVFEGVTAWCEKSTIYSQALPAGTRNVTDLGGLKLTGGANGIVELNNILQNQWIVNHSTPSLMLCSAKTMDSISNTLATAGGNNQIRLDVYQDRNAVVGGLYFGGYVSRYASAQAGQRTTIDVWAHPYFPDGTILFLTEDVPATTVPYSRTGKTFEIDIQTPYEYFELGRTRRSFPYDVWCGQTLKNYWPSAQAALTGIRVDS